VESTLREPQQQVAPPLRSVLDHFAKIFEIDNNPPAFSQNDLFAIKLIEVFGHLLP
jgi:hypothetical protein